MKTVLFAPGFREDFNSRDYKSTFATIEHRGYEVKLVRINWTRTTIDDWVKEFDEEYSKHDPAETILAGFSYGAMTALMAAVNKNPSELWLFSLSPYFSEDMLDMKKSWLSNIGHRRADSFRKLDFINLAKSIKCRTLIVVGEIEAAKYPLIDRRSTIAHQEIVNSSLVVVKQADHDVSDKNYIAVIESAI